MKLKDVILAAMLVAATIAQNYLLYSFPITLTYLFIYIIAKKTEGVGVVFGTVFTFVAVKNIIYAALPLVIVADILGLLLIMFSSKMKSNTIRYFLIPFLIFLHLSMMDISMGLMLGMTYEAILASLLSGGLIAYFYGPLSIILIIFFDGVDYITEY